MNILQHILMIPSWYPSQTAPIRGIFFYEQAHLLHRQLGLKVSVVFVEDNSLRYLTPHNFSKFHFQITENFEDGVTTLRHHTWRLIPSTESINYRLWVNRTCSLADLYITKYGKPDVLLAHVTTWAGLAALEISEKHNIPYLIVEHSSLVLNGQLPPWISKKIQKSLDKSTKILAVSQALAMRITADFSINQQLVDVCGNFIDTDYFLPPNTIRPRIPFRLLVVGSLNKNKGFDRVILALSDSQLQDVELIIGGDGPELSNLKHLVSDLGVDSRVSFLGRLSKQGVRDAMWQANVLISSSYVETFGVVLIEALATGIPVIATRSGGPEDIVNESVGILTDVGDVAGLVNAIKSVRDNYRHYDPDTLRQYVLDNFSAESAYAKYSQALSN